MGVDRLGGGRWRQWYTIAVTSACLLASPMLHFEHYSANINHGAVTDLQPSQVTDIQYAILTTTTRNAVVYNTEVLFEQTFYKEYTTNEYMYKYSVELS